uniref:Uncharacterized protein n=1 Tax=Cacopsylla melanoneura TaxID=428564 RepID=A0A8D8T6N3_9HEMI
MENALYISGTTSPSRLYVCDSPIKNFVLLKFFECTSAQVNAAFHYTCALTHASHVGADPHGIVFFVFVSLSIYKMLIFCDVFFKFFFLYFCKTFYIIIGIFY